MQCARAMWIFARRTWHTVWGRARELLLLLPIWHFFSHVAHLASLLVTADSHLAQSSLVEQAALTTSSSMIIELLIWRRHSVHHYRYPTVHSAYIPPIDCVFQSSHAVPPQNSLHSNKAVAAIATIARRPPPPQLPLPPPSPVQPPCPRYVAQR